MILWRAATNELMYGKHCGVREFGFDSSLYIRKVTFITVNDLLANKDM